MPSRRLGSLVAVLALLAGEGAAGASTMAQRLSRAREQYVGQEYEQVIRLLTPVTQSPIATINEKVEAFELLGLSYLILGDTRRARDTFENLLGLDPGHVLRDPSESPKLKEFFESVKASFVPGYQPHATVTLEHAAPAEAVAGRSVEFGAAIVRGAESVRQVVLGWRRRGLLTFTSESMERRGPRLVARFLLPQDSASYRLEYYLEARDAAGNAVARVGSPERPLLVTVEGVAVRAQSSVLRKWWLWTIIGAVVVGGVTAGVVASTVDKAPDGNLSPGRVELK